MNEQKIWIQLLLLIGIALVTVLLTRSTTDARHQAVRRVLLALFALVTAAAILFPAIVGRVAELVGVGRGTDLLLYLLVIAFLSFIATSLRRVKMLDRRIAELTRELALLQARQERAGLPTAHQPGHPADSPDGTASDTSQRTGGTETAQRCEQTGPAAPQGESPSEPAGGAPR